MSDTVPKLMAGAEQRRWIDDPEALRGIEADVQKPEAKALVTRFEELVHADDPETAKQLLFAGLVLAETFVLPRVQAGGVFRLSKQFFKPTALTEIARAMAASMHVSDEVRSYFQTVVNMHVVGDALRTDHAELLEWLGAEREAGIKGALAVLDWIFLQATHAGPRPSPDPWSEEPETLASGFSTILAIYFDAFGPLRWAPTFDAKAAADGGYDEHLQRGARIAAYREWEVQVDRMGYRLRERGPGPSFLLSAPSEEFHLARELSSIHSYAQRVYATHRDTDPAASSFREFAQAVAEHEWPEPLATIVHEPSPRVRLKVPESFLTKLRELGAMSDELYALNAASGDMLASTSEILAFEVRAGVTLEDVFYFSRLLQFMRALSAVLLSREAADDLPLALQSLLPVMQPDALARLCGHVLDSAKVAAIVELLTTDPDAHIDVQYRPFIRAGDAVVVPLNLLASSNMLRNVLMTARQRLFASGRCDPATRMLERALNERGLAAQPNVNFTWAGVSGEVDVLAVLDNVVLALECKNSLLPTGAHELRTSLDCIETASGQLSRFRTCFEDQAFRTHLAHCCNIAIPPDARLVTGIIMANRVLMGYRIDGHAVRGLFDFIRFVDEGVLSMGAHSSATFWCADQLSGEDIRRFFEEDITYRPQWDAMQTDQVLYEFAGGCSVAIERSGIDQIKLAQNLGLKEVEEELRQYARAERVAASDDGGNP